MLHRVFPLLLLAACASAGGARPPASSEPALCTARIARLWHGKVPNARADEYDAYLSDAIKKFREIKGNVGYQKMRETIGEETHFSVISYWDARESIKAYAGENIRSVRLLPRDPEFLIDSEPTVMNYDVSFAGLGCPSAPPPPMTTTTQTIAPAALVRELVQLSPAPTAEKLRAHLAPYTAGVGVPGPNLDRPAWATESATGYTFLTFSGDVRGVTVWDDSRGWGTHAKIYIANATLADIERVIGSTKPIPRAPDDFESGEIVAAHLSTGGRTVRVFVEHRDRAVRSIEIDLGKPAP